MSFHHDRPDGRRTDEKRRGAEKEASRARAVFLFAAAMRLPSTWSCRAREREQCGVGHHFFLRWKKGLNIYPLPLRRRRKERRSEREGEKVAVILCGTKAIAFSSSWRRRRRRRAIARDSYYWVTFRVNKKAPAFAPRPGCS